MTLLTELDVPIIASPMAGGPSTPALARSVAEAGGLGFLATGSSTAEQAAADLASMAGYRYGVNLFARQQPLGNLADVEAVARELKADTLPGVDYDFGFDGIFAAVVKAAQEGNGPAVVSTIFGPFKTEQIDTLHQYGMEAWVTVTNPADARTAEELGADALIVQGREAGGHRGTWTVEEVPDSRSLAELVGAIEVSVPVVAAGGISTPSAVADALDWDGVQAVALGSAFLLADEAGTSPANRELLARGGQTVSTRAFSGRYARGIETEFTRKHPTMPPIYPYLNPLLKGWRSTGDEAVAYCLVGEGIGELVAEPAADIVARMSNTRATR